jgi:hypothetical protein
MVRAIPIALPDGKIGCVLFCRDCGIRLTQSTAVFLDENNNVTKFPVCKSCYERSIRQNSKQLFKMSIRADYFNVRTPKQKNKNER